ncbi:uncharacterized protein PAC_18904 [Phialocephala subalpina]|uniref:Uncharacterized protein n=1 Tax=Phialocephala subalpina TaxID=576137 RepID=A0A1L7XVD7_9HELO|nr:uncharacterized protein PAC_18904 [Phialocephala subalpina]
MYSLQTVSFLACFTASTSAHGTLLDGHTCQNLYVTIWGGSPPQTYVTNKYTLATPSASIPNTISAVTSDAIPPFAPPSTRVVLSPTTAIPISTPSACTESIFANFFMGTYQSSSEYVACGSWDKCYNAYPWFLNQANSMAFVGQTFSCALYAGPGCTGDVADIDNMQTAMINDFSKVVTLGFNNTMQSWACQFPA